MSDNVIEQLTTAALAARLGSAVAVSVGDGGREVERVLAGHTQRVPQLGSVVTAATLFDVASLTKPMATASLAMAMISQGTLALDRPMDDDLCAGATIAHMLGHASGCIAHAQFYDDLWAGRWGGAASARAALIARAAAQPRATAPGAAAVYSDLGYILLGAQLERIGSDGLEKLFARDIAAPLGMTSAAYRPLPVRHDDNIVATEIDAHRGLVKGEVHDENCHSAGGVAGHAGVFATLDDVASFARAMLALGNGETVGGISPDVAQRCFTTSAAPNTSWRLGWDTPSTTPGVSHAGDRWPRNHAIGHLGFTGTSLWLDLPRRRWVAILSNRVHPTRTGTAEPTKQFRRAVMDAAVAMLDG